MFFKGKGPDPWTAWSPVHPLSSADSSDIERRKVTTAVSSPLKNSVGNSVDLGLGRAQHRGSSHTSHMGHPETTYKLLGFVQIFTSTNQCSLIHIKVPVATGVITTFTVRFG